MIKKCNLTIKNELTAENRYLNFYHHADISGHLISCGGSIAVSFKTLDSGDYVHISAASGPGVLKHGIVIDLPSWLDFILVTEGKTISMDHTGGRTTIRIPPGPPTWMLKLKYNSSITCSEDTVTISNEQKERL